MNNYINWKYYDVKEKIIFIILLYIYFPCYNGFVW